MTKEEFIRKLDELVQKANEDIARDGTIPQVTRAFASATLDDFVTFAEDKYDE